jgi:hypothetical protein
MLELGRATQLVSKTRSKENFLSRCVILFHLSSAQVGFGRQFRNVPTASESSSARATLLSQNAIEGILELTPPNIVNRPNFPTAAITCSILSSRLCELSNNKEGV